MLNRKSNLTTNKRLDRGRRSPSIYSRTEAQVETKSMGAFVYAIFAIFLGGLCYLIFFSPVLRINSIKVSGTKYIGSNEIKNEIKDYIDSNILNNNLLTLSPSGLNEVITKQRGGIKSLDIKKRWPNEIDVVVNEKMPVFTWETMGKKYMIDEAGGAVEEYQDRYKDFPIVTDTKNVPVTLGRQILSGDFVSFIKELTSTFTSSTGAKITKIEVPEITSEVKVTSSVGWYALFDTTRTAKGQLVNLDRVLLDAKSKKHKLEYIDLRIDSCIFYK